MKRIISINKPKSPIAEAYRMIRTNIEFSNLDKEIKTIVVTSSQQNEGKSTVIANLGVSLASLDKRVIVVEGDLRNPTVHRMFGISNIFGVVDAVTNKKSLSDCICKTDVKNLNILPCGPIPHNPAEMLSSNRMKNLISSLKEEYDYVLIDTPPIGIITDASIMSTYTDGTILVVASKEVDIDMAKISKDRLEKVNANVLGVILNKYEDENSGGVYYNYYYGHDDTNNQKKKNKKKHNKF